MKHFIFLLLLIILSFQLFSQTYIINQIHNQNIATCSGSLYDTGGATGNYSGNEHYITTLIPTSTGSAMVLTFSSFNISSGDCLIIYDGQNTNAVVLARITNLSIIDNPTNYKIAASTMNPNGKLTIEWKSLAINSNSGWKIDISCGTHSQRFKTGILSTSANQNTTINGIELLNQNNKTIQLCAKGIFQYNNANYQQSNYSTTFYWDFGNGQLDTGQCVTVSYAISNVYKIKLIAYDINGYRNFDQEDITVKILLSPYAKINPPDTLCLGDTYTITLGRDSTNNIVTKKLDLIHFSNLSMADTTYLPDGTGVSYSSNLIINNFSSSETISDSTQITKIFATIEHSYIGDLDIRVTCPTNKTLILKSYPGGGSTYLGEAYDNNSAPIPGVGYTYYWTPDAPINNKLGNNSAYIYTYTNVANQTLSRSIFPPSDFYPSNSTATICNNSTVLPYIKYSPINTYSNLYGCSYNGVWTITVTDNLGIDNGYIFNWGIELNKGTHELQIDSIIWQGTGINNFTDTSLTISALQAGNNTFDLSMIDELGNHWDTSYTIYVYPPNIVQLNSLDSIYCFNSENDTLNPIPSGGTLSGNGLYQNIFVPTMANYGNNQLNYLYTDQNNCTKNHSFTTFVQASTPISFQNIDSVYCLNDSPAILNAQPFGGHFMGSGIQNNTFHPLIAGIGTHPIYYEFIDTYSCVNRKYQNIHVLTTPIANAGTDKTISCITNDSIQIGTSQQANMVYHWTPAIGLSNPYIANPYTSSNMSIFYTLRMRDAITNCRATDTVYIEVLGAPFVQSGDDTAFCRGGTAALWAAGGHSYEWSTGDTVQNIYVSPHESTDYYVIINDLFSGCSNIDTMHVEVFPRPQIQLGKDTAIWYSQQLFIEADSGYSSYLWQDGSTYNSILFIPQINDIGINQFWVDIVDSNLCRNSDTLIVLVMDDSGIEEFSDNKIIVFPNPAKDKIYIESNNLLINNLKIFDMKGRLIFEGNYNESKLNLDIMHLSSGTYLISGFFNNKQHFQFKFIKNKI